MRAYCLPVMVLAGLLILSTTRNTLGGETPTESRRLDLIELISRETAHSLGLPPSVATAFVREIPERLLLRNDAGFLSTPEPDFSLVRGFHIARRIPWTEESKAAQWFCYLGGNRGFCAIIEERGGGAEMLWSVDGIASLSSPSVEFVELTGRAPREIIIGGYPGLGSRKTGEVVSWDGRKAVRLTEETRGFHARYWEYVDLDSTGTKGILLHDTEFNGGPGGRSKQLLKYYPDSNAMIAGPKKVVGNKK